ncbi:MAG: ATP synthase F1 subunit delta [Chloroflexi bacterium]|nr:ATP synthase F1 subunit delta [Chloroflexota bacterium]
MALGGSGPRRYAEAVLDIATAEGAVPAYHAALEQLGGLAPSTVRMLGDPGVPLERRLQAADAATKGQPDPVRGLVALLVRRHRMALIGRITDAFTQLVEQRAGIARARVTTAVELDGAARDALVSRLSHATGKTIRATFAVDPDLLGGARLQVGDHLVDASLRARLHSLLQQLAR